MIKSFRIRRGLGCIDWNDKKKLTFLSKKELDDIDQIGYSGKTQSGKKIAIEEYLNSLGKGSFIWTCTRWDNGDFSDEFSLVYSDNLPYKALKNLNDSFNPQ